MNAEVKVLPLPQELTGHEYKVFELLRSKPAGEFTSRSDIEMVLYGREVFSRDHFSNCVQVFILRMRRKGVAIETKKGRGYRLAAVYAAPPVEPASISTSTPTATLPVATATEQPQS
jgi:DNA-binding response OmpR family regulator